MNRPRSRALVDRAHDSRPRAAGRRAFTVLELVVAITLVNGYSGYFPDEYADLRSTISAGFPSRTALATLAEADVEYVVVDRPALPPATILAVEPGPFELVLALSGEIGVDVYRLKVKGESAADSRPPPTAAPPPTGR